MFCGSCSTSSDMAPLGSGTPPKPFRNPSRTLPQSLYSPSATHASSIPFGPELNQVSAAARCIHYTIWSLGMPVPSGARAKECRRGFGRVLGALLGVAKYFAAGPGVLGFHTAAAGLQTACKRVVKEWQNNCCGVAKGLIGRIAAGWLLRLRWGRCATLRYGARRNFQGTWVGASTLPVCW